VAVVGVVGVVGVVAGVDVGVGPWALAFLGARRTKKTPVAMSAETMIGTRMRAAVDVLKWAFRVSVLIVGFGVGGLGVGRRFDERRP